MSADKSIKTFAEAHKLSKEAVDALTKIAKDGESNDKTLIDTYKAEQAKVVDAAREKQKGEWYNQLKTDKDFGGEQFQTNLKRVDTILNKFLPNTKNLLTETKGVLSPNTMKDLLGLHKVLLGSSETMVQQSGAGNNETDNDSKFLTEYYK